ncbi:MAG: PorV/PorQ family protein, partial [Fidelibacterota bacterium]
MKKILPVILIFTVIFGQSNFNKVGSVGVLFLNLPAGAAAQGMGNAYSSSIQGASAVFWNPALLGWSKSVQSFLSYSKWLLDLHHQTAAITFRLGRFGIGVSQSLLKSSPMLVTTTSQPRGTGEYFQYYDLAAGFSVARAFSDRFSLGGSFKIIHESAYEIHATGWGIDIGSFYWIGFNDWRITMVLRNFGPDMQF